MFRTSVRANEDIYSIYLHGLENFGRDQAERYGAGLLDVFERLAERPLMARERQEYEPAYRVHFYRQHAVFYLIQGDDVLIVRVLHSSQDWARHV